MTHTFQPRATARIAVPKAAVDFPFPSPVLTITIDDALLVASAGPFVGTSFDFTTAPQRMRVEVGIEPAPPRVRIRS